MPIFYFETVFAHVIHEFPIPLAQQLCRDIFARLSARRYQVLVVLLTGFQCHLVPTLITKVQTAETKLP